MYMTVGEASAKFNISKRRVQALCKQGRFVGAYIKDGVWLIPSGAPKPDDARKREPLQNQISMLDDIFFDEIISLDEACNILSISKATMQNWIRLGKITPLNQDKELSKNYILSLQRQIMSGEVKSLVSRRNKKMLKGKDLYSSYSINDENKSAIEALISSGYELNELELRVLLSNLAVQLYYQSFENRRLDNGCVIFDFLKNPDTHPTFYALISDLIGVNSIYEESFSHLMGLLNNRVVFDKGEDTLGFAYISLKDVGKRKNDGIYYTPRKTVEELIVDLSYHADIKKSTILDPCCGTGNFFIGLLELGADRTKIYGQDIDLISVQLARINMLLHDHSYTIDELYSQVVIKDTLKDDFSKKFDVVLGNPPWGVDFTRDEYNLFSETFEVAKAKSVDSYDLFVERAISLLNENGILSLVLPEAILNVGSHTLIRRLMLEKCSFKAVSYLGNAFLNVQCPAIILSLSLDNDHSVKGCRVKRNGESYVLENERTLDLSSFSFLRDSESDCLGKIEATPNCFYLKDNAKFALGIVTGDNKGFISNQPDQNKEIILKGSDILRYGIKPSDNYISFTPEKFQQVAKTELYRAKEKLLYRFICALPVFAYDDCGTLSLNSCNILIPAVTGVKTKYILAILNSSVCSYFISEKFKSIKLLRSHIEAMPIPYADNELQEKIISLVDAIMQSEDKRHIYDELDSIIMELYGLSYEDSVVIKKALCDKGDFLE